MVHLGNTWDDLLQEEFAKDYYQKLRQKLIMEYRTKIIYPDMHHIFEALKLTAYDDVRVVILGQDPYFNPGQAHGLSFSVQIGIKTPPSLLNIYKELQGDLGCFIPNNGYLIPWAKQGVLLLNAALTVRGGEANSHKNLGWENFTDRVIQLLNDRQKPMVFLLWGKNAMEKSVLITNKHHLILTSTHPSPLSAHRGFLGCRHFSKANGFLKTQGDQEINWQIPNV